MRRAIFLCVIVTIGCHDPNKSSLLKKSDIDTLIRNMNKKVDRYWDLEMWDSVKNYLNAFKDTVQVINDDRLTFRWILRKVHQLTEDKRYDSASAYLKSAMGLLGTNRINYKDSFSFYIVCQNLLKEQKLYDSAIRAANEAYYISLRNKSLGITTVCLHIAQLYAALDDVDNMRKYVFEAWRYRNEEPDLISDIAKLIMFYYDRTNKVDSAIYYLKVIERFPGPMIEQPGVMGSFYENTGVLLLQKGRIQEGLQSILKAKRIADSIQVKNGWLYNNLADAYGTLGQFGKAFLFADSSILLAKQQNDYQLLSLAWRTKSELYLKTHQYKTAYAALDSSFTYFGEESNASLRKHARELETKYAVREKDYEIKSLAISNQANIKIRNQQKLIIIAITISVLLLSFLAVVLWRRRQLRMALREINLKQQLLRAQIEPHFLSNALELLRSLIRSGEVEKGIGYLNSLAKLMRFNFENANETFVPLRSEIEALRAYLNLQTIYNPGLFDYKIEVYEDYEDEDILIPPMLFQPFVENSILHGFKQINYKGMITVKIERHSNSLYCTIDDNGVGFQSGIASQKIHSTKINQERLSILARQTGITAELNIVDKKSQHKQNGVRVEIEIPVLSKRMNVA